MSKTTLSIIALAVLCIAGCTKKSNSNTEYTYRTVYLENKLNIGMVGYDCTELTTIIVKKFLPGNTFTNLVDSTVYTPIAGVSNWSYFSTTSSISTTNNDSLINPSYTIINKTDTAYTPYDYEIVIPSNGRIYKLYNITFSGSESIIEATCCPLELSTRFANYALDGQPYVNVAPVFFQGVYVWLQK